MPCLNSMFEHGMKKALALVPAKLLQTGKYGTFELSLFSRRVPAPDLVLLLFCNEVFITA